MMKNLLQCSCNFHMSKGSWVIQYVFTFGHFIWLCVRPVGPRTVFNITPTKLGHMRQKLMKHMWRSDFAPFPSRTSSRSGLHIGYEEKLNLLRVSQESPVQYNLKSYSNNRARKKVWGAFFAELLWHKPWKLCRRVWACRYLCSDRWFYKNWHMW